MPYALLYKRLRAEARSGHDDSWVSSVSLGSVRTLVGAMDALEELQSSVDDAVLLKPDGVLVEAPTVCVERCDTCDRLRLSNRDN